MFVSLITMFLGVFHLEFILFGIVWVSLTGWSSISSPILGKLSTIISSSIFSCPPPFFVLLFWDTYDSNVGTFNIVPEVSKLVLISFYSFFFSLLCFIYFHHYIFHLTYPFFYLSNSTLASHQSVFNLSHCTVHYWLTLLYFFKVLVKHFLIFSIHVSSLFICNSILFSRFWIIFTIIILNSFPGRLLISFSPSLSFFSLVGFYPIPSPAGYFSAFSLCLVCCVCGPSSAVWRVMVPLICGVCFLWVGLDQRLIKVSWLGKLVSVFCAWSWISSLWSAMKCPIVSFGVSMGLDWLWAAHLLKFRFMFLFCWIINVVCLAMELAGSWVELCFSVGMEILGWALVYECSLGSGVLWWSTVLELSLLPLGFGPPLSVASGFLHPHSTEDKTPCLMVKQLSTARNTQSNSQSYIKKTEAGDGGEQEEKRECEKGREQSSQ